MPIEKIIENTLTEWQGKTIANHNHFMKELEDSLRSTYEAGCNSSSAKSYPDEMVADEATSGDKRDIATERYETGFQHGYLAGAQALLTELKKVEENNTTACRLCHGTGSYADHDNQHGENGECIFCPIQVGCEDCHGEGKYVTLDALHTLREKKEGFLPLQKEEISK